MCAAACWMQAVPYVKASVQKGSLSCSAGFAGSRSGALIATAWSSLVHMGEQGFMHITHQLMQVPPHNCATFLHATCSFPALSDVRDFPAVGAGAV